MNFLFKLVAWLVLLIRTQAFPTSSALPSESNSSVSDKRWPAQLIHPYEAIPNLVSCQASSVERDSSVSSVSSCPGSTFEPESTALTASSAPDVGYFQRIVETIALFPPHPTKQPSSFTTRTKSSTNDSWISHTQTSPIQTPTNADMGSSDIFDKPIDTRHPPSMMKVQEDHPVPRVGVAAQPPLQTNKFYANFFLGDQRAPTYTFPYSLAWAGGKGSAASWGMACSHIEAKQRVFGQEKAHGASAYFLSPVGIESMVISAKELGSKTALTTDSMTAFSARVHLSPSGDAPPAISFPLVQGMAYVTAEFSNSTPIVQSGVFFKTVTKVTKDPKSNMRKFNFNLEDGSTWRVYAWSTKGEGLDLQVVNNGSAEAKRPFTGVIQITKDPMTPGSEDELDDGAGVYPLTVELSGSAAGSKGSYTFRYRREGHSTGNIYTYALPHHIGSFDDETRGRIQKAKLQTTTKGIARLVKGTEWTMVEPNLPIDMGFAPWHPQRGSLKTLSDNAKGLIQAAASKELSQNMIAQTNLDSMYFSGKVS